MTTKQNKECCSECFFTTSDLTDGCNNYDCKCHTQQPKDFSQLTESDRKECIEKAGMASNEEQRKIVEQPKEERIDKTYPIPQQSSVEWEKEFDEKMIGWIFHHKTTPCCTDDFALNEIKSFIKSLLQQQKEREIEEIGKLLKETPDFEQYQKESFTQRGVRLGYNDGITEAIDIIKKV